METSSENQRKQQLSLKSIIIDPNKKRVNENINSTISKQPKLIKQYECSYCGHVCTTQDNYRNHLKRYHRTEFNHHKK